MNPNGTIYELREGEKPKPGDFKLTEAEKRFMETLPPPVRAPELRRVRGAAAGMAQKSRRPKRRPRSCLPKSLRR